MNNEVDPEATPKPLQVIRNVDIADRTPYIPRRKSSVDRRQGSSYQDGSTSMSPEPGRKPLHPWARYRSSNQRSQMSKRERKISRVSLSKAKSPADTYNAVSSQGLLLPVECLTQLIQKFAKSYQGLPHHDRSSVSSSESQSRRRLFSRIISGFTHNSNSTQAISTLAKSLGVGQDQLHRLSGSTAGVSSSRTTSMASSESTETSLVRVGPSRTRSADRSNSPNHLGAPPLRLLERQETSDYLFADQRLPSASSMVNEIPSPALATAILHTISNVQRADLEKAATIWIAIDVECDIHYAEDSASSLRSKALGPPHTDPGFLSRLGLDIIPANGCRVLRLVGSDNRDFLLPGETWSILAQVNADPPLRRKQTPKAFSLQSRPSSHALMDQLQNMLSPSGASSQELVHVNVTFEHALLPSDVQCCVNEKLSIDRVSAWSLESRRQYLRHRQSPRKRMRSADQEQQQRHDDVACKLLHVLELTLHDHGTTGHREAIEILEEFFDQCEVSAPLHQRARELLCALEAKIRPVSRAPISPIKRRRNGMDLSRENLQLQLQDITNQWSGRRRTPSRDVPTPAPLFSPRKRPSVANLQHGGGSSGSSPAKGVVKKQRSSPSAADVGSPRFYEDEVDEASRIWRGMRDSSVGSNCFLGAEEGGDTRVADGDGEENERGREVVGAPWL
jgi:hypothetical protein